MSAPKILSVETLYSGWGRMSRATVSLESGAVVTREIEHHGDAAVVLPYDPDRRVATLVRQLRTPILQVSGSASVLEAPAGGLDGDDPETCARREVEEEAGLRVDVLEPVSLVVTMPGISTERLHLYLATYGDEARVGAGGGLDSEHEEITVEELPLADLARMVDDGRLDDLKTMVLVQTLRLRRPELFVG